MTSLLTRFAGANWLALALTVLLVISVATWLATSSSSSFVTLFSRHPHNDRYKSMGTREKPTDAAVQKDQSPHEQDVPSSPLVNPALVKTAYPAGNACNGCDPAKNRFIGFSYAPDFSSYNAYSFKPCSKTAPSTSVPLAVGSTVSFYYDTAVVVTGCGDTGQGINPVRYLNFVDLTLNEEYLVTSTQISSLTSATCPALPTNHTSTTIGVQVTIASATSKYCGAVSTPAPIPSTVTKFPAGTQAAGCPSSGNSLLYGDTSGQQYVAQLCGRSSSIPTNATKTSPKTVYVAYNANSTPACSIQGGASRWNQTLISTNTPSGGKSTTTVYTGSSGLCQVPDTYVCAGAASSLQVACVVLTDAGSTTYAGATYTPPPQLPSTAYSTSTACPGCSNRLDTSARFLFGTPSAYYPAYICGGVQPTPASTSITLSAVFNSAACQDAGRASALAVGYTTLLDLQSGTLYTLYNESRVIDPSVCYGYGPLYGQVEGGTFQVQSVTPGNYCVAPQLLPALPPTIPSYPPGVNCSGCPEPSTQQGSGDVLLYTSPSGQSFLAELCPGSKWTDSAVIIAYDPTNQVCIVHGQQLTGKNSLLLRNTPSSANTTVYTSVTTGYTGPLVCSGIPNTYAVVSVDPSKTAASSYYCPTSFTATFGKGTPCAACQSVSTGPLYIRYNSASSSSSGVLLQKCPAQTAQTALPAPGSQGNVTLQYYYIQETTPQCSPSQYAPQLGATLNYTPNQSILVDNSTNYVYADLSTTGDSCTSQPSCFDSSHPQPSGTVVQVCPTVSGSSVDTNGFCASSKPPPPTPTTYSPYNYCRSCPSTTGTLLYGDGNGFLYRATACAANAPLTLAGSTGSAPYYVRVEQAAACQDWGSAAQSGRPYLIDNTTNIVYLDATNGGTCSTANFSGTCYAPSTGYDLHCITPNAASSSFITANYCQEPPTFPLGKCAGCPTDADFLYSNGLANNGNVQVYRAIPCTGNPPVPPTSADVSISTLSFAVDLTSPVCTIPQPTPVDINFQGTAFIIDKAANRLYFEYSYLGCKPTLTPASCTSTPPGASPTVVCVDVINAYFYGDYCVPLSGTATRPTLLPEYNNCGLCQIVNGAVLYSTVSYFGTAKSYFVCKDPATGQPPAFSTHNYSTANGGGPLTLAIYDANQASCTISRDTNITQFSFTTQAYLIDYDPNVSPAVDAVYTVTEVSCSTAGVNTSGCLSTGAFSVKCLQITAKTALSTQCPYIGNKKRPGQT